METRKIKVVGFPGRDGDVVIQTNYETGARNAQVVINCSDIIMIAKDKIA